MSAGCPVIAGNNSSQIEVAGDAALMVDASSIEDIARATILILSDPKLRAQLIERGRRNFTRFRWSKVADKTAMYLREFVAQRTRHSTIAAPPPRRAVPSPV